MPTEIPDFVIITRNKTFGQGEGEHRPGNSLRNCFVSCPRCSEIWLVPGAIENEKYSCVECQHVFFIEISKSKII